MGRFYETARFQHGPDFSRKLPYEELIQAAKMQSDIIKKYREEPVKFLESLDLDVSPGHSTRLNKINKEYSDRVDTIVNGIQSDRLNAHKYKSEVNNLRNEISKNLISGELKAMQDYYTGYKENKDLIKTNFAKNPLLFKHYTDKLDNQVTNSVYNPEMSSFGEIEPLTMYKDVTQPEIDAWTKNRLDSVKETFKGKIPAEVESIDELTRLIRAGDIKGVTYKQLADHLSGTIPQEFINSFQQTADAQGIEVDESLFQNKETGEFDLSTKTGRLLHSIASGGTYAKNEYKYYKENPKSASITGKSSTTTTTDSKGSNIKQKDLDKTRSDLKVQVDKIINEYGSGSKDIPQQKIFTLTVNNESIPIDYIRQEHKHYIIIKNKKFDLDADADVDYIIGLLTSARKNAHLKSHSVK